MAKKKGLADRVNEKRRKAQKSKPVNPFEMHFNRRKTTVLGQNTKQEQGFPGLSRSNAIKKRKGTLLQEYKSQNKANKFIDQRIGERNADLSENDRAMARFVAHRSKEYKKKFVLDDMDTEEVLTHRGQTLNEIEKFDNPNSDDDEDDDYNNPNKSGKLDAQFVKEGHFGGGVLTRTGVDGARSHRDLINELISESKKRKADKQKAKEQTLELTDKLNAQWEDLKPWVSSNVVPKKTEKKKADTYDMMIAKLMQEGVHPASDRLKTEDELAKEEKEKLEKLEKDRVARMRGTHLKPAPKHRSADDLDDGFVYNRNFEVMLAYDQEGKCLIDCNKLHKEGMEEEDEDSHDENEKNKEESDDDEVETESEDNYSDLEEENNSSSEDEERGIKRKRDSPEDNNLIKKQKKLEEEQENNSSVKENGVADNVSEEEKENEDANEEDEGSAEEEESAEEKDVESVEEKEDEESAEENKDEESTEEKDDADSEEENNSGDENEEVEEKKTINENEKQEIMEKAKEELPFTFEIPDNYEDFHKYFSNRTIQDHGLIIERMIKCNHPKLANENKDKMDTLFVYLLQYINDISCDFPVDECFKILGVVLPNLFDLAQMNQANAPKAIIEVITEKQMDFRQSKKRYPDVDVLFFLKIVSSLFTTSDVRNKVVTPCFVFMEEMLYKCRVKSQGDIAYGLFLVTLVLEYTNLSKRYQPAAIAYLSGVLRMAIPKAATTSKVLPPFRSTSNGQLALKKKYSLESSQKLEATDLVATEISEDFKIRALYTTLKLIGEFVENFEKLPSKCEIFEKVVEYLQLIPQEVYPKLIQKEITSLLGLLQKQKSERTLQHLVLLEKPKALRMYEPKIRPVYDLKRHAKTPDAEKSKLVYKLKKERKGALREIRKDRRFLSGVQINERIQSDQQRIKKVKRIYAEASVQQGELKKMERKNKRK